MITVEYTFVAGRYHATPWNRHVNEGHVEWPPGPWRILRALVATGYRHLGWQRIPPEAESVLERLCSKLPTYALPPATLAHSRHYAPVVEGRKQTTSLMFDTWLNPAGPVYVTWDVDLDGAQRQALERLLRAQTYLGRAESWVDARLFDGEAPEPVNCKPLGTSGDDGASGQPVEGGAVSVLAPVPSEAYAQWRAAHAPPPLAGKVSAKARKQWERQQAAFPESLLDSLVWDTADWKGHGWSRPPGTRWVDYGLDAPRMVSLGRDRASAQTAACDIVLFALGTPARSPSALPTVDRTLPQAELLHQSLVSVADPDGSGSAPAVFTGRDGMGRPLRGHRHAHLLPVDTDGDGHLDHVILWAPMGLEAEDVAATYRLRRTWTKGGAYDIQVAVAGQGTRSGWANSVPLLRPWVGAAKRWVSATPFVPPRYLKKRGKDTLEGQVRAEIDSRGLPEPVGISCRRFPGADAPLPPPWKSRFRHFVRRRGRSSVAPPSDAGFYVVLDFEAPVRGPLALGYGSHYGLGVFVSDLSS